MYLQPYSIYSGGLKRPFTSKIEAEMRQIWLYWADYGRWFILYDPKAYRDGYIYKTPRRQYHLRGEESSDSFAWTLYMTKMMAKHDIQVKFGGECM